MPRHALHCRRAAAARGSWRLARAARGGSGRAAPARPLPAGASEAAALLHKRGFLTVRLPPRIVSLLRQTRTAFREFFALPGAHKEAFRTPQDGELVLSHPAYLTPDPGWAELFEVRCSKCDASYRIPPACAACGRALHAELRAVALRWLRELSRELTGAAETWGALAASDSGPSTLRAIHYDRVPVGGAGGRRGFPTHTDSTLLTLAPRADLPGLRGRDYASGAWLPLEENLAEDEAVLFCGDALAFCSAHHLPALMHRAAACRDGRLPGGTARHSQLSRPLLLLTLQRSR